MILATTVFTGGFRGGMGGMHPRKKTLNFGEDLFFFFFWRPPHFGRKKRSSSRFRPKNHSQFRRQPNLCLKSPPPKFSRSATDCITAKALE